MNPSCSWAKDRVYNTSIAINKSWITFHYASSNNYWSFLINTLSVINKKLFIFGVVQAPSHVQLFATPWTTAHQALLSFTISLSLHKFMSIESVVSSNNLMLCCPFSFCPQSFPASGSFPMSQLFTSGGQSAGASALASVLPIFRVGFL